jgi:hypothetical protein
VSKTHHVRTGARVAIPMALLAALAACELPGELPTTPVEEEAPQFWRNGTVARGVEHARHVDDLLAQIPRLDVQLAGTFTYSYVQAITGMELTPWQVYNVRATVTFTGHDQMVMTLDEHELGRVSVLEGQMTPSGVLRMEHTMPPAQMLKAIVTSHLGCTISGPFPIFSGRFDGTRLVASTRFTGRCREYWEPNDIFPTPVDGPVHATWAMDLTVVP